MLACSEAIAPFGRQTFVIQSCIAESSDNPHLAGKAVDQATDKTARCNKQCSEVVRAYLIRQRIWLRVGQDLNNKPIRKFHQPFRWANSSRAVMNDLYERSSVKWRYIVQPPWPLWGVGDPIVELSARSLWDR